MSIRTCVARAFCVIVTAGVAGAPDPARAGERTSIPASRGETQGNDGHGLAPGEAGTGFLLDRLSKGHVRIWRAIEQVVAASGPSGEPRSPTLRRLWEWARTSTHVLHVEMVSPSRVPAGLVGVFRVERVDPAGLSHVAVIRLCPWNIRHARVGPAPNAVDPFVRFEGLTEVERYAEVLAHELAHAEYFLENPERLAQLVAAQSAIEAFLSGTGPGVERRHLELERRLPESLAVLAATEAHAESVEAIVLRELAGGPAIADGEGAGSIAKRLATSTARVPIPTILGSTNRQVGPPEGEDPRRGSVAMALEAGSRLGPYEVVGLLGSGGMGEVYRARDPRLEREVAIKVLPEEIADPKRLHRFEQEARAAGALNHPNVLAVYDVGTHEGAPYVVSELLEGQTLRTAWRAERFPSARPSTTRSRSPTASPPLTTRGSSTATSSPRTSSSPRTAGSRSWTSAWPS